MNIPVDPPRFSLLDGEELRTILVGFQRVVSTPHTTYFRAVQGLLLSQFHTYLASLESPYSVPLAAAHRL